MGGRVRFALMLAAGAAAVLVGMFAVGYAVLDRVLMVAIVAVLGWCVSVAPFRPPRLSLRDTGRPRDGDPGDPIRGRGTVRGSSPTLRAALPGPDGDGSPAPPEPGGEAEPSSGSRPPTAGAAPAGVSDHDTAFGA
ncbi:hypothetical protein [Plantactinospora veratri]